MISFAQTPAASSFSRTAPPAGALGQPRFQGDPHQGKKRLVFLSSRDQDEDRAKRIIKDQVQQTLGKDFDAYFWKVYKHKHHWDVYLAHRQIAPKKPDWHPDKLKQWLDNNREALNALFAEKVQPLIGRVHLVAKAPIGPKGEMGECCKTGCGGCAIGPSRLRQVEVDEPPPTSKSSGT